MLPALSIGEEEREGMKMGEDEQDIVGMVGQSCGVWKAKSWFVWLTQRGQ